MFIQLCLSLLLQSCLILASDTPLRSNWPNGEKIEKWLISVNSEKQSQRKFPKWPQKKNKAVNNHNPFKDSEEDLSSQCSASVASGQVKKHSQEGLDFQDSASIASKNMSRVSSQDSFFNTISSLRQVIDPLDLLRNEETDLRDFYESINLAERQMLEEEYRLIGSCLEQYAKISQNALIVLQVDSLAFKAIFDKKRTFTIMDSKKGALKMQGFNTSVKDELVDLLNCCDDRLNVWEDFVSKYKIHATYRYLVLSDVYLKS